MIRIFFQPPNQHDTTRVPLRNHHARAIGDSLMITLLAALVAFSLALPAAAAGPGERPVPPAAGDAARQQPSLDTARQHAELQRDREQLAALRRDLEALRARTTELRAQVDDLHRQIAELNSRLARGPVHAR